MEHCPYLSSVELPDGIDIGDIIATIDTLVLLVSMISVISIVYHHNARCIGVMFKE